MAMELLINCIAIVYLVAGLAGFVSYYSAFPTLWPQLDHPFPPMRIVNRALAYAACNIVALLLLLLLLMAIEGTYEYWSKGGELSLMPPKGSPWLLLSLLLCPVPPATGLLILMMRWQRAALRQERIVLRKNGVLPPVRLRHGTPMANVSRSSAFAKIDLHDDELVRELARGHWQAISNAKATHGNASEAVARQRRFLYGHLSTLEPSLANTCEIFICRLARHSSKKCRA